MYVNLPSTGCNIISSSTAFYNYSTDGHVRSNYVIYDGKALKSSESYSQAGYNYTGECLETGDLVYKPELKFYENVVGTFLIIIILFIISVIFMRKWWRVLR